MKFVFVMLACAMGSDSNVDSLIYNTIFSLTEGIAIDYLNTDYELSLDSIGQNVEMNMEGLFNLYIMEFLHAVFVETSIQAYLNIVGPSPDDFWKYEAGVVERTKQVQAIQELVDAGIAFKLREGLEAAKSLDSGISMSGFKRHVFLSAYLPSTYMIFESAVDFKNHISTMVNTIYFKLRSNYNRMGGDDFSALGISLKDIRPYRDSGDKMAIVKLMQRCILSPHEASTSRIQRIYFAVNYKLRITADQVKYHLNSKAVHLFHEFVDSIHDRGVKEMKWKYVLLRSTYIAVMETYPEEKVQVNDVQPDSRDSFRLKVLLAGAAASKLASIVELPEPFSFLELRT